MSATRLFASAVLALAVLLPIVQYGPGVLAGREAGARDAGSAPEFADKSTWLNSPPLTMATLQGKVLLVQFWTYTCINWLHTLPYIADWDAKYRDKGLVVVGVHTPEFAFEMDTANVQAAIKRFGLTYPVVQDNEYRTWNAYENQYWPALYLIDKSGKVVATHFGEGAYAEMEGEIARLVGAASPGSRADPDLSAIGSPELYLGPERNADAIVGSQSSRAGERTYVVPDDVPLDRFALSGTWKLDRQSATLQADGGEILVRFRAPKVNLVAGSVTSQNLAVMVDGMPQPSIVVQGSRLYTLYEGTAGEHVLRVTIPNAGLSAFSLTFG
jgi:thiol-disulfide isomerase/thioredoxin